MHGWHGQPLAWITAFVVQLRISARSGLAALHLLVFSRHAGVLSTAQVRLLVAPARILQAAAAG